MTKKNQSRIAKMVLASLLAVSLSVPTFSGIVSANSEVTPINAVVTSAKVLKDGEYEIVPAMTKGMNSFFQEPAKLIVEDGKMVVQLVVVKQNEFIGSLQSERNGELVAMDTVEGDNTTATRTVNFPVAELGTAVNAHVVVNVSPERVMAHDFEITVTAPAEEVAVTVYKDGTNEESVMKGYVVPTVSVVKTATGNTVTMSIKKDQEQYIHGFKVNGKDAIKAVKDGVTMYSFEVADLTKRVNAELHVIVDAAGVKYDSNHEVQLGFAVNEIPLPSAYPFTDIEKDGNQEAILALFDKGIVKGNAKFNPANNINRSQFALMVYRALEMEPGKDAGFKDIASLNDAERVNAINALADAGIVKKGGNFNPNNTLTRQQGALMLYRAVNYVAGQEMNYGDTSLPFYVDGKTVTDPEAQKAFALLHTGQIMTGSPTTDGKKEIKAGSSLTRSQMAKILHGSLQFMDQK